MKTKHLPQKTRKSILPVLTWVLPSIPWANILFHLGFILHANYTGEGMRVMLLAAVVVISSQVLFLVCGGGGLLCAILSYRKYGKKKRHKIAILWSAITLALGILLIAMY